MPRAKVPPPLTAVGLLSSTGELLLSAARTSGYTNWATKRNLKYQTLHYIVMAGGS